MNNSTPILESCVDTIENGIRAENAGAHRLEFCADLQDDGLSPKIAEIEKLLSLVSIPVRLMVRPVNSFYCSDQHLQLVIETIRSFKNFSLDGLVLGYLDENNRVDIRVLESILKESGDTPISFHKAIDSSSKIIEDVKILSAYHSIDYILTSGGETTAWNGRNKIIEMQDCFPRSILAGGGITRDNLAAHHNYLNLQAYHGRKIV